VQLRHIHQRQRQGGVQGSSSAVEGTINRQEEGIIRLGRTRLGLGYEVRVMVMVWG
jgi:hypothetical protein